MAAAFDANGRRTATGWAWIVGLAALWFGIAWAVPPLGVTVAVIHLVCAIFDMMMNGSGQAEFAPFNLAGAVLAGGGAMIGSA